MLLGFRVLGFKVFRLVLLRLHPWVGDLLGDPVLEKSVRGSTLGVQPWNPRSEKKIGI